MKRRLGIVLRDVSVRRGEHWALRDISLELRAGERWALFGANGSGKTQLLKLLAGAVWPTPTGAERRLYRRGGRIVDLTEAKTRIVHLGAERQDRYARHGWNLPVRDVIATGLHRTDLLLAPVTRGERARVEAELRSCGLVRLASRRFLTLSQGEKRLVLLARAIVQDPDWLLLDEVFNGLDERHRRRVHAILQASRRRGQSWIVAAHRAADVPPGTTGMLLLAAGRLAAPARYDAAVVEPVRRRATQAGRAVVPAAATARPTARTPVRMPVRTPADARARAAILVRLEHADLFVEYRRVLRDLNWDLRVGEQWAVTGANGAGKTSFLKLLYGDLSPALGGKVTRRGCPAGTPIERWKRRTAYLSPELQTDYLIDVPVEEVVVSGRHASIGLVDPPTAYERRIARRWLNLFELGTLAGRRPRELSYGELRRALLARAMMTNPRLLLLDEPLTGLDPGQRELMRRLLERLARGGASIVMAVHHTDDLPRGITRVLRLHNRRARAGGLRITDGVGRTARRSPA